MRHILRNAWISGALVWMAFSTGSACTVGAAELDQPWRLWAAVGGGEASHGAAVMGELVFQKGPHQISARAMGQDDPYDSSGHPTGEIGLLYGRGIMGRHGHASLSAGLAVTDTDMDSEEGMTLGVPLVAEVGVRIASFLGMGGQLFANLNPNDSYSGLTLFLQFGYMPASH